MRCRLGLRLGCHQSSTGQPCHMFEAYSASVVIYDTLPGKQCWCKKARIQQVQNIRTVPHSQTPSQKDGAPGHDARSHGPGASAQLSGRSPGCTQPPQHSECLPAAKMMNIKICHRTSGQYRFQARPQGCEQTAAMLTYLTSAC